MKTYTSDYISRNKKDYYDIVIDKVNKKIFALKNFSCYASELEFLCCLFNIEYFDAQFRFSLIFSNNEIDINLIPKKYRNFEILN